MKKAVWPAMLLVLMFSQVLWAGSGQEAAVLSVAEKWLVMIDQQEYEKSYQSSASFFQRQISADMWSAILTKQRKPFGALSSRKPSSTQFATELPGVPDGNYAIIQYQTAFANKAAAVETVSLMLEQDNVWRVAGYFIK